MRTSRMRTLRLVLCAFFVALTAVCAQIQIPLTAVPISLALMPVFLCGALLGPGWGAASMAAYALLAAVGVPVLSGFMGGAGVLFGPTGGYIAGYCACAGVTGFVAQRWGSGFFTLLLAMTLGLLACYACGTGYFMFVTGTGAAAALSSCVLPFLPGDALKMALCAALIRRIEKPLGSLLS